MRLIDSSAIVHIQLFDEEHEEHFTKKMTVGRMIEEYTEEMEIETVDAIPVEWILKYKERFEKVSSDEANISKTETLVDMLAEWAERKEKNDG